jgi:predicted  nucleic acid-binding Zn-ribbon protein
MTTTNSKAFFYRVKGDEGITAIRLKVIDKSSPYLKKKIKTLEEENEELKERVRELEEDLELENERVKELEYELKLAEETPCPYC